MNRPGPQQRSRMVMPTARHPCSAGATLTEVLVSVAVLAMGILIIAGALTESLQALAETRNQQRAMRLAADIGELLANLDAELVRNTTVTAAQDCAHTLCSREQFLTYCLQYWHDRVAQMLPAGDASVEFTTSGAEETAEVRVEWATHGARRAHYRTRVALAP